MPYQHDSATPWLQERLLNLENLSYLTARDVLFLFNFFTVTVWFFFSISFLPFFEKRKLWNAQRTKGGRPVRVASLWTCLCGCARVKLNSLGYCCTVKLRPEPVIMACASITQGAWTERLIIPPIFTKATCKKWRVSTSLCQIMAFWNHSLSAVTEGTAKFSKCYCFQQPLSMRIWQFLQRTKIRYAMVEAEAHGSFEAIAGKHDMRR